MTANEFKLTQDDRSRFLEYEAYYRKVLVLILNWPESRFKAFVRRERAILKKIGAQSFFHDPPYKQLARVLLDSKLKKAFQGGDGVQAGYKLIHSLNGKGDRNLEPTFDIVASRKRYIKTLERLRLKAAKANVEKTGGGGTHFAG
jgi:hypothetical protein